MSEETKVVLKKKVKNALIIATPCLLLLYGAYRYGRHEEAKLTWYSQLLRTVNIRPLGPSPYFIDVEMYCPGPNGKDVGRLQIDFNLRNGTFRVVRNDPKLMPSCE